MDKVVRQQMGQKKTKGSGSCWGKKGHRDQAAVGERNYKGIKQQWAHERMKGYRQQLNVKSQVI